MRWPLIQGKQLSVPKDKPTLAISDDLPLQLGIGLAFCLCFLYWHYLFLSSNVLVKFDSIGYQDLGRMIYEKGWVEYFRTGPNREPLYPFLISLSMHLAHALQVPYLQIQKFFQFIFLFMTQLFTLLLMNRFKIRDALKAAVIVYIGISPSLINSSLSLLSEVMALPLILLILDLEITSWQDLVAFRLRPLLIKAFWSAFVFTLAVFTKGVFLYMMYIYLLVFLGGGIYFAVRKKWKGLIQSVFYVLIVFLVVQSFVVPFKLANQTYNGQYVLTNRYNELLFGNTYKRVKVMDRRTLLAHIASVPGGGVCRAIFTEAECRYCEFQTADDFRGLLPKFLEPYSPTDNKDRAVMHVIVDQIKSNPLQYIFLTAIEASKVFFWESTQLGFVDYPGWLRKIYDNRALANCLRLAVSGLTVFCFFAFLVDILSKIKFLFISQRETEWVQSGFFFLVMIASYAGLYGLFSLLTRYALVMAPVFLMMGAWVVQNFWQSRCNPTAREKSE